MAKAKAQHGEEGGCMCAYNIVLCRYLLPPPPAQRMGLYVCRLLTVLGLLLLLGGAAAIVVGYCWPREQNIEGELMRISIDQDEEGNFYVLPERLTEIMASIQDPMHIWKMTGHFVFSLSYSSFRFLCFCRRRIPDGPFPAGAHVGSMLWRHSACGIRLGR